MGQQCQVVGLDGIVHGREDFKMEIKLPIFIIEGDDIAIYKTLNDARNNLEISDVSQGIYKGYDAEGYPIRISVENKGIILAHSGAASEIDILKAKLKNYLEWMGDKYEKSGDCDVSYLLIRIQALKFRRLKKWWRALRGM